eukprot:gnl/TRDRNA2_/TRDRNA2_119985_c2_seq1.p1 gnl/TRDRNA2_/TRDRNA2_119985_c2~~gnl/TRDRNA2_/TRDRNA2_119985_c2_seq1.p1  ORF type:complete len:351 (-),score=38.57 gnl/TRDRNA2_/TRDRNA2_119985_c2_seq1:209-1153(-)
MADAKGVLFLEITRLLHRYHPASFVLENVPQLEQMDSGKVIETILTELRSAGYAVIYRVLNARPLVPQRRLRLYLVGFALSCGGEAAAESFKWPKWANDGDKDAAEYDQMFRSNSSYRTADGGLPTEVACRWPTVGDILEPPDQTWPAYELTPVKMESVKRHNKYWNHELGHHFVNERGAARTLIASYLKLGRSDQVVSPLSASLRKEGSREAEEETKRHPRYFTPRECCRLMGFPEWYKITNEKRLYHELGNAVCPPVIKAIMEGVLNTGVLPCSLDRDAARKHKKRKTNEMLRAVDPEAEGRGRPRRRRRKS